MPSCAKVQLYTLKHNKKTLFRFHLETRSQYTDINSKSEVLKETAQSNNNKQSINTQIYNIHAHTHRYKDPIGKLNEVPTLHTIKITMKI